MRAYGCSAAVRVTLESTTASMHFQRVGEDDEAYSIAEAQSVEQAAELLDKRREQTA